MGKSHRFLTFMAALAFAISIEIAPADETSRTPAEQKMIKAIEAQNHGWYSSAKVLLDEAEALDPNVSGLLYYRAIQALGENKPEKATAIARKSLAAGKNVADCHTLLGFIALKAKDNAEAAREFQAAIKAAPSNARGYYNYSEYLREVGKPDEALVQINLALKNDPQDTILILKKRLIRLEAGDVKALASETTAALKGNSAASWLLTGAAIALKQGDTQAAIPLLQKARDTIQPEIFLSVMSDPFFRKYAKDPALADFYPQPQG